MNYSNIIRAMPRFVHNISSSLWRGISHLTVSPDNAGARYFESYYKGVYKGLYDDTDPSM